MNRPRHPKAQQFVGQKLFDGLVCFRDLETRIEHLPTEQQRGDAFEVFAEAYFATQRIVAARHVWPDKRISPSLRAKLKLHSRDVGADGVIETVAGKYRGYQAKFRSGRTPLTWTEVATFSASQITVTTGCCSRTRRMCPKSLMSGKTFRASGEPTSTCSGSQTSTRSAVGLKADRLFGRRIHPERD